MKVRLLGDDEDLPDFQARGIREGRLVGFFNFLQAALGVARVHFLGNFAQRIAADHGVVFARAGVGRGRVRCGGRGGGVGGIERQGFLRTALAGAGAVVSVEAVGGTPAAASFAWS